MCSFNHILTHLKFRLPDLHFQKAARPRYCLIAGRCRRGCRVLAASSWLLGRRSILSECLMHSANTRATLGRRSPSLGLSKPAMTRTRTPADSDNVLLLRQYRVPHQYNVFRPSWNPFQMSRRKVTGDGRAFRKIDLTALRILRDINSNFAAKPGRAMLLFVNYG